MQAAVAISSTASCIAGTARTTTCQASAHCFLSVSIQAAEASSEEEVVTAEAAEGGDGQEEGEIVPPAPVVDKKTQRLQARRAAAMAAAEELRVSPRLHTTHSAALHVQS